MARLSSPVFLDRTTPPTISTLILLAGVSAIAMNLFLPSLPSMAQDFNADYGTVQLSVAIFLAANALLQILLGPLSDRYGRRPVILAGVAGFILASLGCALASTVEVFLFFRTCQAVVVAGLVLGRAAVRDMVPDAQAASMIGYVTMGMAVVPMIAPSIGGLLDTWLGWRSGFVLMALLGGAIFALVWSDFGETARPSVGGFADQVRETPILLRARRFWGYCAVAAFASGGFFAFLGGAPYVGAEIYGLSPAMVGLVFGAPAIGYIIGNGIAGRFSVRLGIDRMVLLGTVLTTGALVLSALIDTFGFGTAWSFFGLTIFLGLGNGMVLPNANAGMLSVRPSVAGTASGLGGALMLAGGAALSSLAGIILGPDTGAAPLIWMMAASSAASVVAILYVIRRARVVGVT